MMIGSPLVILLDKMMESCITMAENLLNHSNWLFISFEQTARGHKLARVLSALPSVYWFSHPDNGISPWNIGTHHTTSRQRQISKYHYDRLVPGGTLPPPYDYIREYLPDPYEYYNTTFIERFKSVGGQDLLDQYMIPYCTHSTPDEILEFFPNSKIINIIHDIDECVNRYFTLGGIFPGVVKHRELLPSSNSYLNYLYDLDSLISNRDLTVRDIWAFKKYNRAWRPTMESTYRLELRDTFTHKREIREECNHPDILNIPSYIGDYNIMKAFIHK
jgi:hypothetical protein